MKKEVPAIGVIGGSGLYQMDELRDATERKIDTPFGPHRTRSSAARLADGRFIFCRATGAAIGFCRMN